MTDAVRDGVSGSRVAGAASEAVPPGEDTSGTTRLGRLTIPRPLAAREAPARPKRPQTKSIGRKRPSKRLGFFPTCIPAAGFRDGSTDCRATAAFGCPLSAMATGWAGGAIGRRLSGCLLPATGARGRRAGAHRGDCLRCCRTFSRWARATSMRRSKLTASSGRAPPTE